MKNSKISKFLNAPLSNKLLKVRHLYWLAKTQFIYRHMFKEIGKRSVIYKPLFLCNADCIEIADCVSIRDGVRLEAVRDSYGRTPSLTIGSNTNIEQGVHIVCHNRVKIGRGVSITARCAIVDVSHPYENVESGLKIAHQITDEDSFVEIDDEAVIGYGAVILPNVRIGKRAMVGANAVVTQSVPDFAVVAGVPAKIIKQYSQECQKWVKP